MYCIENKKHFLPTEKKKWKRRIAGLQIPHPATVNTNTNSKWLDLPWFIQVYVYPSLVQKSVFMARDA